MRIVPSRISGVVFRAKAGLFQVSRAASDLVTSVRRFPRGSRQGFDTIVAEARSDLWKLEDPSEAYLQFGKVQNLRCAIRRMNGVIIPAGGVFSFWKQIGKTTTRKGYTMGRELREGCLVPSLGGGLCQLSNTLYDAVLKAGFQIVERHTHSQIIPGSAAAEGRDATVFWNYVDFRFSPSCEIYIEIFLTRHDLVIKFLGNKPIAPVQPRINHSLTILTPKKSSRSHSVNNCFDCGTVDCFRHSTKLSDAKGVSRTAFVLDEYWPELNRYLASTHKPKDIICVPLDGTRWNRPNYAWDLPGDSQIYTATWKTFIRAAQTRKLGKYGAHRLQAQLESAEAIASRFGRNLPPEVERVCVSQTLLPYLWSGGYLGGRTFDVLMTRVPLYKLHQVLDSAAVKQPRHATLSEYRAPDWIVNAEKVALKAAEHIITPHSDIQTLFPDKTVAISWHLPVAQSITRGKSILFPGPTAARKGAYELRDIAGELNLEILLPGSELEGDGFWSGIRTKRVERAEIDGVGVVVHPALLEDRPRTLLKAISCGLPVVATHACGLSSFPQVRLVEFGDKEGLKTAITEILSLS